MMTRWLNVPILSTLVMASMLSANAMAEVYMCKDEKGRKVFSDIKCQTDRVEVNVKVHSGRADESGSGNNVFDQLENLESTRNSGRKPTYSNSKKNHSSAYGMKEMSASDRDKVDALKERLANVGKESFGHATPLQQRMDREERQSIREQIDKIKDKYR